jgi:hypothetical protein
MLATTLGIRLLVWVGTGVPRPAPSEILDAFTSVVVTDDMDGASGFELTFSVGKDRSLDYDLVHHAALVPGEHVVLGLVLGATPAVLMDGVITTHQLRVREGPGGSAPFIHGSDPTVLMDLEGRSVPYKNLADALNARQVLLQYAAYAVVPPPARRRRVTSRWSCESRAGRRRRTCNS